MLHMAHYHPHPSSIPPLFTFPPSLPPSLHLYPGPVGRTDSGSRQSAALNKCIRGRRGKGGHISKQRVSKGGRENILSVGGHTCTVYRGKEIHRYREKETETQKETSSAYRAEKGEGAF